MLRFCTFFFLFLYFATPITAQSKPKASYPNSAKRQPKASSKPQKSVTKAEVEAMQYYMPYKGQILAYPNGIFGIYPDNIAVGKCYKKLRYWCGNNCPETIGEKVMVSAPSKYEQITPAEKNEVRERLIINEAVSFTVNEKEVEQLRNTRDTNAILSLYFAKINKNILIAPSDTVYSVVPAKFKTKKRTIETQAPTSKWVEWHIKKCTPYNSPECKLLQLLSVDGQSQEVTDSIIVTPEKVSSKINTVRYSNISVFDIQKKLKITTQGVEINLPMRFQTITKTSITRKGKLVTIERPAVYKTINRLKLIGKDGCCGWYERWFEVPCADFEKSVENIRVPPLSDTVSIYTANFQKPKVKILSNDLEGSYPFNAQPNKCYQQFYTKKNSTKNTPAKSTINFPVKGKWVDYKIKNCPNNKGEDCIIRKLEDDSNCEVNIFGEQTAPNGWELKWFEISCNSYDLEEMGF